MIFCKEMLHELYRKLHFREQDIVMRCVRQGHFLPCSDNAILIGCLLVPVVSGPPCPLLKAVCTRPEGGLKFTMASPSPPAQVVAHQPCRRPGRLLWHEGHQRAEGVSLWH